MSRRTDQRISDILPAIDRCQRYVGALDAENHPELVDMAEDAIERNLQIIGEAANHLPTEITDAHPEIGWPQMRGLRNILVHQYFGVDIDVIRDVIETDLQSLGQALRNRGSPRPTA